MSILRAFVTGTTHEGEGGHQGPQGQILQAEGPPGNGQWRQERGVKPDGRREDDARDGARPSALWMLRGEGGIQGDE